jgi:predicted O-methyltransferase YrrM
MMQKRLLKARDAWMQVMSKYRNERGLVCPPAPPMLEDLHLEKCQLISSRDKMIRRMPQGGRVAEVGVLAGDFSRILLDGCSPSELHLIDINLEAHQIRERFADEVHTGKVILHQGKSSQVLKNFADRYFDFIYIDADHSYKQVKKDIQVAKRKIRQDGFLVFNDYTFWSPVECIPYGVMQAVNELCLKEGWEVVFFALDPYMYCDVAIRRL